VLAATGNASATNGSAGSSSYFGAAVPQARRLSLTGGIPASFDWRVTV